MADDKRFSHITVNAGEDDDVVIQAGAYATTPQVQADDYNEQTLEDLEAGPMSGMQKAVLAGVAIIIVAAIVYFTCFMH